MAQSTEVKSWQKSLSKREAEVCLRVADGKTNKEIGREMKVTWRTVEAHLRAAYRRLNVRNRVELARIVLGIDDVRAPAE